MNGVECTLGADSVTSEQRRGITVNGNTYQTALCFFSGEIYDVGSSAVRNCLSSTLRQISFEFL